jgi:hypothetical protein
MRPRHRAAFVLVGFAGLALVTGACSATLPRPSQLVTLIADGTTPICPGTSVPHAFNDRLLPNGGRAPFTIPAGKVLVLTSYDWVIEGSSQPNNTVWTTVALASASGSGYVYVSAFASGAMADSIGRAAGYRVVPSGVPVRPGTTMCFNFVGGANAMSSFARIHGFLADDN